MKRTTVLLGLGVLFAITLISASATADVCADAYNIPLGKLRVEQHDCYKEYIKKVAREDKAQKFDDNALPHLFVGELQFKFSGSYSNEFDLPGGVQAVLADRKGFYGIEGGWVDKKLFRDLWAAIDSVSYLKADDWWRDWLVDNITFTLKGGYQRGLSDFTVDLVTGEADQNLENKRTFTVGGGYTVNFDKALGFDID